MMDGSLRDGKDGGRLRLQLAGDKKVVDLAHSSASASRELGCLGSLETMRGDKEDGHGAEITMTKEMLLTDPDQAADFRQATQLRRAGHRIGTRTAPTIHPQADRRHPGDRAHQSRSNRRSRTPTW